VHTVQEDERRDTLAVYALDVIRLGDPAEPRYRMYFAAWATDIRGGTFAVSSRDGLTWTRDPVRCSTWTGRSTNMVSEP